MDESFAAEVAAWLRRHPMPGGADAAAEAAPDAAARAGPDAAASWPAGLPESLGRFCAVLAAANERLNLTGITDARGMAALHVLDSLAAAPLLAGAATAMDLGSGGGVPGIPLALARPSLAMTLVESRERKAAALAAIVDELGLAPRVTAVHARGEQWLTEHAVDVVLARAVEGLPGLLKRLRPVRRRFGRLVLMKGPGADEELAALGKRLESLGFPRPVRHAAALPEGAGQRVILEFRMEMARGEA
ncbi:MAG TPA: 16S rRNA (guanine(527)-N(7))-methyltransferase RsmG [Planctomycetota bacterium]|nr:16S rRNA (guanine(527)-N(7))-methyltransferase RsmG [Planctomycetota bacterium]